MRPYQVLKGSADESSRYLVPISSNMEDGKNMLLNLDVSKASEFIEAPEVIRKDQVIPGHFRPCPESPYGQGFDWLYRYELKISAFLKPWLKPPPSDLIGEKSLLHQALSNAYCHAHHRDPLKPITVRVLLGSQGLIIQVNDCGKGFKVQKVYKHYRKKRRYLTCVGNGIRLMAASSRYGAFYNQQGTAFHLLYPFHKKLDELSSSRIDAKPEHQN
jgi:hypothetical protein